MFRISNMNYAFKPSSRWLALAALLTAPSVLAQTTKAAQTPADATNAKSPKETTPPTKEQCIESHRGSQQAQNEGHLVRARELARTCTSLVCPGLLVSDCARWLNDLDQRIPSVVFEVRLDGKPNKLASVFADGKPVAEWTRGESFRVDPGDHEFRFELPNHEPLTQSVLLAEGMRYRVVSAEFKSQVEEKPQPTATESIAPVAPPPAPPKERPTPFIVYPLIGVGALGIAGFATFAALGKSKETDLEDSCGKVGCTDDQLSPMMTKYLIGDISLGIGAASLIAAGVVYFTRPEKEAPNMTVGFTPTPGGFAGFASYRF